MEMGGQLHPWATIPVARWLGGWVGPRVGLDVVAKRAVLGSAFQPVASHLTD